MPIFIILFVLITSHLTSITSYTKLFEDLIPLAYFVDKSIMLRILFDDGFAPASGNPYYFISCPRYFGKSANLRMIQSFASFQYDKHDHPIKYDHTNVYKIFKQLKISDYPYIISEHMSRYPVIYLNLQTIGHMANYSQHVANDFTAMFLECLYDHPKLLNLSRSNATSDDHKYLNETDFLFLKTIHQDNMTIDQTPGSLFQLCRLMYEFYSQTQVILLIDNYDDTALHSFTRANSSSKSVYHMINSILSRAFDQGRRYIKAAVITGISSLGYVIGDSLRHLVTHYPFLDDHQFAPYFGLSENELVRVLIQAKYNKSHRDAIIDYYKGYVTFPRQTVMYNPYTIGNYFLYSKFNQTPPYPLESYWTKYETLGRHKAFTKCPLIRNLLINGTIRYPLKKLHSPDALEELEKLRDLHFNDITESQEDILMTLYFETGYLSHTSERDTFAVPNKELRDELLNRTDSTRNGLFAVGTTQPLSNSNATK